MDTRPALERKLSVIVIAKNEEDRIGRCLASVEGIADEIIVLDSGSEDSTVEIASRFTDKVYQTDWPGYGKQKQRALDKASCEWVLSLDADEALTAELRQEIAEIVHAGGKYPAYEMRWAEVFMGKRLNYGATSRYVLRLFRKGYAGFSGWIVHEKVVLPDGSVPGKLKGRLLHYSARDFDHLMQKNIAYASLMAKRKHAASKRSGLLSATLRAGFVFIRLYVFRLGVLDGAAGFLLAVMHSQYTFNKYSGLWYLNQMDKQ